MPFGYPLLSPVTPANDSARAYFKEYEDVMAPALEANKVATEQRYQATVDMTNAALSHIEGLQNPVAPQPIPNINPLGAAAAGFFANLNANQSGSGATLGGLQNTLSSMTAEQNRVADSNAQATQGFQQFKAQSTEDLHMQLLKAQRDNAAEMGDLDKTFQYNKSLYALERQRKKEELAAQVEAAQGKATATGAQRLKEIEARAVQARLTAGVVAKYRKAAEGHATTPAQRARLAMANAQAAELRANVDDMRGARDIAGDPLYSDAEIASKEESVKAQIKTLYESAIADFEAEKDKGTLNPPKATQEAPTTPPVGSDAVRAAAERLRGTALFSPQ